MRSGMFDNTEVISADFARFAGGLLTNGVLADTDDALKVSAGGGMHVSIAPGYCWINGRFGVAETAETLTIPAADGSLGRIDRVVARLDLSAPSVSLQVLKGEASAAPVAPDPVRSGNYYDLGLATVVVPAGTLAITAGLITDTRADNDICGAVIYRNADSMALDSKADITMLNEKLNISDSPNYSIPPCRKLGEVFADEIATFGGDAYAWIQHRIQTNNISDIYLGDTLPPFQVEYEGETYDYTPRVWRMWQEKDYLSVNEPYIDFMCDEVWFYPLQYQGGNYGYNNGTNGYISTIGEPWLCSKIRLNLNGVAGYYVNSDTSTIADSTVQYLSGVTTASPSENVFKCLPENLQAVIVEKTKVTSSRMPKTRAASSSSKACGATATTDAYCSFINVGKLWLPTEMEYFGYINIGTDKIASNSLNLGATNTNTLTAKFPEFRRKISKKLYDYTTNILSVYTFLDTPSEGLDYSFAGFSILPTTWPVYAFKINAANYGATRCYSMICFTIA